MDSRDQQIEELKALVAKLTKRVAELELALAKAKKDSSTSSKPPSSDITKPQAKQKKPGRRQKPRRGGQPGHERHLRELLPPERVDETIDYEIDDREMKRLGLTPTGAFEVLQHLELPETPVQVTEHRLAEYQDADGYLYYPDCPELRGPIFGPRLLATIGWLKSVGHCSYSTVEAWLEDVLQVPVSRGYLSKLCTGTISQSLADSYHELVAAIPREQQLGSDETSLKDNGKKHWIWCITAACFSVFHIAQTRSREVLEKLVGEEFSGYLNFDYFSANCSFAWNFWIKAQYCWAHLIRDIRFLEKHPDQKTKAWAEQLLGCMSGFVGSGGLFQGGERAAEGGGAWAAGEEAGESVVVAEGGGADLQDRFGAGGMVPEHLGSLHAVVHLLHRGFHPGTRGRQALTPIGVVTHSLAIVFQVAKDQTQLLARVVLRGLLGRQAQTLLMRKQFADHAADLAAPNVGHPACVCGPGLFGRTRTEPRRAEQITDRVREVEDRREVAEARFVNCPIASQAVAHERLARRLEEPPTTRFALHLRAELPGTLQARKHRPQDALRLVRQTRLLRFALRLLLGLARPGRQIGGFSGLFLGLSGLGQLGDMLGIQKARGRIGLRFDFRRRAVGADQDRVLGFVPAFNPNVCSITIDARCEERVSAFNTTNCRLNPGVDSRVSVPNATR